MSAMTFQLDGSPAMTDPALALPVAGITLHGARRMGRLRRLHFIGIGGSGMSGIAELMHNLGYLIQGSDRTETAILKRLRDLGITVYSGHQADQIQGADVIVISSAIAADNPELQAAQHVGLPIVRRAEMLAELMRFFYGVAVAGTHGKTTTTSLIASVLAEGHLDPTFVIGGRLNSAGTHARLGESPYLVAEADESDGSFLLLHPMIAVVTNIDADHLSTYDHDFERLQAAFVTFLQRLPFYGLAVVCIDDPHVRAILPHVSRPLRTYGLTTDADVCAIEPEQQGTQTRFLLRYDQTQPPLPIQLNLPGTHNILNALAACTVALELGVTTDALVRGLARFQGVGRRFAMHTLTLPSGQTCPVIDDYGHHPQELAATFAAIRQGWPHHRLVVVFQPHRYSRTQELFAAFVDVLSTVELVVLCDVYAAGEQPRIGADTASLCQAIADRSGSRPIWVPKVSDVPSRLLPLVQANDIVLIAGAGDIGLLVEQLGVVAHSAWPDQTEIAV
jgi:UDP-N-acetylmuramate--alanine ligase